MPSNSKPCKSLPFKQPDLSSACLLISILQREASWCGEQIHSQASVSMLTMHAVHPSSSQHPHAGGSSLLVPCSLGEAGVPPSHLSTLLWPFPSLSPEDEKFDAETLMQLQQHVGRVSLESRFDSSCLSSFVPRDI